MTDQEFNQLLDRWAGKLADGKPAPIECFVVVAVVRDVDGAPRTMGMRSMVPDPGMSRWLIEETAEYMAECAEIGPIRRWAAERKQ